MQTINAVALDFSGRFFPDVIEAFGAKPAGGISLYHKFQQLYSATPQSTEIDLRGWQDSIDVIVSDQRLATVSVDKSPSRNNIRENNKLLLRHLQVIDFVLSDLDDSYDYILIDSHPEISDVLRWLRCVIYASDYCVSPVKPGSTVINRSRHYHRRNRKCKCRCGNNQGWLRPRD